MNNLHRELAPITEVAWEQIEDEARRTFKRSIAGRRVVDLVGPAHAREIFFTARQFTAEEALGMGLVNRVVPEAELENYVDNYCAMIAGNAPLTVRAAKVAIREALKDERARDLALCKRLVDDCFASADYAEGRTAFMEKRKPQFAGR